MKKIKYYLTVTTFCLAIAQVAATKANSRVFQRGYLQDWFTGNCTLDGIIDCEGGFFPCRDGSGNQLYQFNGFGPCEVALTKP